MFTWNLVCFGLCPLPLVLPLGTTEKGTALSFWIYVLFPTYLQVFLYIDEIPLEPFLLQTKQCQLSQPFLTAQVLQSLLHLCGPLDSLQYVCAILYWGAQSCTQRSRCGLTSAEKRRITSLSLLATSS